MDDPEMMGGKLAAALAKAQGEMKNAVFNQTNPHYKSKYADLGAVRDATIPALSKHGLAITQKVRVNGNGLLLITTLRHSSGEYEESEWPIPLDKPQIMGSAMTYGRRYSWAAMCGIASEQDDDGNEGQKGNKPTPRQQPPDMEEIDRQREEMDAEFRDAVGPKPRETLSNVPHLIPLPPGPKGWEQWCKKFYLAASTADTVAKLDSWVLTNDEQITALQGFNEKWHAELKKRVKDIRDAFAAGEP